MATKNQEIFQRLKETCVPLLRSSLLTPSTYKNVSTLLTTLTNTLRDIQSAGDVLTPALASYIFFPISTILQRNSLTIIPDHILEKLLTIMSILCDSWWWDCDIATWEQCFMMSGAVIAGIEGKGKQKERDEETKQAAAQCLFALLRDRASEPDFMFTEGRSLERAQHRLSEIQGHISAPKFIPVIGQVLDSLLGLSQTENIALQRLILKVLDSLIALYIPEHLAPSVLPGVVSNMCKVALGVSTRKGWANGDIVAEALQVLQHIIVKSIGDDICLTEGAVRNVESLEDLSSYVSDDPKPDATTPAPNPHIVPRTPTWLRGTSSQLHIALNSLTPLVKHPTVAALVALSEFSSGLLTSTILTLGHSQALLLSFVLSLSSSPLIQVSASARGSLVRLLDSSSSARHGLLQTLMQTTRENLAALPRLLPSHDDVKVEHMAGIIEAVCNLADSPNLGSISAGVGRLLGPMGGIEKWGWSLLSVLELMNPAVSISQASAAQLMLEGNAETPQWVNFPELTLENVSSRTTYDALERMFSALGRAAGDDCLFSVEWFVSVARNGRRSMAVAAMWCACRLLEGAARVSLQAGGTLDSLQHRRSKRLEKLARGLAKSIAELWDDTDDEKAGILPDEGVATSDSDTRLPVEFKTGLTVASATLQITRNPTFGPPKSKVQPMLHRSLCLQMLSITAGVLQAQFTPLLLHTLYPVLHSLVSTSGHLSSTALATLNYITISASYATPANLLLANFDYALDSVSRRLTRRWLDVDATKVLTVLVRLVGSDVVDRAGDVVEECFDRLDDFHGYEIIVDGLVQVLDEVIKVVKTDKQAETDKGVSDPVPETDQLDDFVNWFKHRHDEEEKNEEEDTTDYGPAPREDWGKAKEETADETARDNVDPFAEPPPTAPQALTKQIVSRSIYFLTHGSPVIRSRILLMLSSSAAVLPESALMPSIHQAWPFVLNRLSDPEPFVVASAASLVESLIYSCGSLMYRRVWDDVWPRFRTMLSKLDSADAMSALAKRGHSAVGTESAYTHSHRLYRSLLRTMTATAKEVDVQDSSVWQVLLAFRRFLSESAHQELQECARELYTTFARKNSDAVWLVLTSTTGETAANMVFLWEPKWNISKNVNCIIETLR